MTPDGLLHALKETPRNWLVTGVAGFIGSHLLEALLMADQTVTGLDNFATGHQANLDDVKTIVGAEAWRKFTFIRGDVRSLDDCRKATTNVDFVLHEAALASVPLSIQEPIATNESNIDGFLNLLVVGRDNGVKRFIYAPPARSTATSLASPSGKTKWDTPSHPMPSPN